MPAFVPGLELARDYWFDVVAPILDPHLAAIDRAAALIGEGSDVLGFDTEQSTDHGWGPRVLVFLADDVQPDIRRLLASVIDEGLLDAFRGYPTKFSVAAEGPSRHQVILTTVGDLVRGLLGFDPRDTITAQDWLRTPTQLLRSLTSGVVFEDGPGDLTEVRRKLQWYPNDVWMYVLGCQWRRLDQEEPFVGRAGQVDDDLGSAIIGARLIRDQHASVLLARKAIRPVQQVAGHGVRSS